ncbi:MAG TPA: hypothetical protein VG269_18460 [Tepidisphaeraceae bacterium]|jgi:hypothetical protein|nr:hypothetical protein [Tepidisphaeraceae bacterium]
MHWRVPGVLLVVGLALLVFPHHGRREGFEGSTLASEARKILKTMEPARPRTWNAITGALGLLAVLFPGATILLARLTPGEWPRLVLAIGGLVCLVGAAWTWLYIQLSQANFMTGVRLTPASPFEWITPGFVAVGGLWLIAAAILPAAGRATGAM